eukprot:COSAG02_NODE_1792_length_10916_cov_169.572789_3_plen_46_part_00
MQAMHEALATLVQTGHCEKLAFLNSSDGCDRQPASKFACWWVLSV